MLLRNICRNASILLLAMLPGAALAQEDVKRPTIRALLGPKEPIAYAGHGHLFSRDGTKLELSPEFLRDAQERYIRVFTELAPKELAAWSDETRRALRAETKSRDLLIAADALLLWVLTEASPAGDTYIMHERNRDLLHFLVRPSVKPFNLGPVMKEVVGLFPKDPPEVEEPIDIDQGIGFLQGYAPLNEPNAAGDTAYMAQCRNLSVPIPPDFPDPAWIFEGEAVPRIVGGGNSSVLGYQSQNPPGICIGLPTGIGANPSPFGLFGIFCISEITNKACFWDKEFILNPAGIPTPTQIDVNNIMNSGALSIANDFAQGAGGGPAAGICTDCHAGENPFVVYPGSNLNLASRGYNMRPAGGWHVPLASNTSWPRNRDIADLRDREDYGVTEPLGLIDWGALGDAVPGHDGGPIQSQSCVVCHDFPDIGHPAITHPSMPPYLDGYCGTVLPFATGLMPPSGAQMADWAAPENTTGLAYWEHLSYLLGECSQ